MATASSNGQSFSSKDILKRTPSSLLIPTREIKPGPEGITLGFRQEMLSFDDERGEGSLTSGAGCGNDYLILTWRPEKGDEAKCLIRGSEVYKAWMGTIDPELALSIPGEVVP